MPRWDCTGKHRGVGDADLGLKVWPNHVNMRRIMILGVQGDLVASEVFDRWHRVALQKRIYGIDCRISRKNGSACRFYKAPLGPAKISAFLRSTIGTLRCSTLPTTRWFPRLPGSSHPLS